MGVCFRVIRKEACRTEHKRQTPNEQMGTKSKSEGSVSIDRIETSCVNATEGLYPIICAFVWVLVSAALAFQC